MCLVKVLKKNKDNIKGVLNMELKAVGKLVRVVTLTENEDMTVYGITVGEKNNYRNQETGNFERTFIQGKFFANSEAKKDFIENKVKPIINEDYHPIAMDLRYRNNNYGNAEGQHYSNDHIVTNLQLYL